MSSWRKPRWRIPLITAGVLVAALIGLRLALPGWMLKTANAQLQELGEYRGHIEDIDIHLWRGAYSITNLVIEKTSGQVPVPLLSAPLMDIAISWDALLRGGVVAHVHFDSPELTLVDGRGDADSQSGRGVDWRNQLEQLLPIKLDELWISNGTVNFRNFISKPQVDLHATEVEARVDNLTNVRDERGARPALLTAKANILDGAPLEIQARFDPFAEFNDVGLELQIKRIHLPKLNDFFRAYALLDVESGAGEITVQMETQRGRVSGYVKPLFRDIKMIDWKEDIKNPLRLAWEALAATMIAVFKNHKEDQLATRIDFEGSIENPKVNTLDAIGGILHNAFVKALGPELEKIKGD